MSQTRILLAEDSPPTRARLAAALHARGYVVMPVRNGSEALAHFEREQVDLVLSDQRMPRLDGLGLLEAIRRRGNVPFVLYSADAAPDVAFRAARLGAARFLAYPFEVEEQLLPAIEESLVAGVSRSRLSVPDGAARFLGTSPAAAEVRARIRRLAPTPATVLILGETGVGKEVVARALHEESGRSVLRSVAVTELAETLLESELFGHERGAFTGAHQRRVGKIEAADGGTLLLDEISELSPDLQVKLLRVLEERRITRVGGNEEIAVDFRLLAATNRNLEEEVEQGRFRRDLYYRLKVVTVELPPLRQRPEDIPPLVNHFVALFNNRLGREVRRVTPAALAALKRHRWPGNVRELRNVVENMVLFAAGEEVGVEDLPEEYRAPEQRVARAVEPLMEWGPRRMEEIEREAILQTLAYTGGHRARAAQLLDIGLRTLQRKLKEYGVVGAATDEES